VGTEDQGEGSAAAAEGAPVERVEREVQRAAVQIEREVVQRDEQRGPRLVVELAARAGGRHLVDQLDWIGVERGPRRHVEGGREPGESWSRRAPTRSQLEGLAGARRANVT